MSKDNIQEVVKKSLEKYFKDLGEQMPSNVYEMVVFTVEKPILEAVMERAEGNQSHAQRTCWVLTATPCARYCSSTIYCNSQPSFRTRGGK